MLFGKRRSIKANPNIRVYIEIKVALNTVFNNCNLLYPQAADITMLTAFLLRHHIFPLQSQPHLITIMQQNKSYKHCWVQGNLHFLTIYLILSQCWDYCLLNLYIQGKMPTSCSDTVIQSLYVLGKKGLLWTAVMSTTFSLYFSEGMQSGHEYWNCLFLYVLRQTGLFLLKIIVNL